MRFCAGRVPEEGGPRAQCGPWCPEDLDSSKQVHSQAQARSVVGAPSCLEARSRRVAALSDSACSRRLLCRRLRTSSSRAALSAFSWGLRGGGRSQSGQHLSWGSPVSPCQSSAHPHHLLQVLLQLPEHGLQMRDLLGQAPGFWPEDMGVRTQ